VKKWLLVPILTLFIIMSFIFPCSASDIDVFIDGNKLQLDNPPIIQSGRTLAPMRAFFEALGAGVNWEADTETAVGTRDGNTVRIPIGSSQPTVNGQATTIQVPAQIIGGRTYIPLRFVGEALGDEVVWDGTTSTITITRGDGKPKNPTDNGSKKEMAVHFLDVGQGDSILIKSDNVTILIDGGPRSAGQKIVSYLKKAGVSSIDLLISTHPHEDHIGGLASVLQEFPVIEVIDPGIVHTTKTFENYLDLIYSNNIKFTEGRAGMSRDFGNNIRLEILHPSSPSSAHLNDASIVAKVTYNQVSFMFTGDAEEASEQQILLQSRVQPISTVLKVGHHGSNSSTSAAFLQAVDPEIAVIMCGEDNTYGHPHEETLQKLSAAGVDIYRTDINGDIVITTDGQSYSINNSITPFKFEPTPTVPVTSEPAAGAFVGSVKSEKYHYPSCRYAESIVPENQIWFDSVQDAKNQGYSPCGVCRPPQ
jgi:competence protein ComEC